MAEPNDKCAIQVQRKINVKDPIAWHHHRGGWKRAVDILTNHFHNPEGTLFLTAVEDALALKGPVCEPWIGVLHQAPRTKYEAFPDLYRLMQTPEWRTSIEHCQGIFVLCRYLKEYLTVWNVPAPICFLPYPIEVPSLQFSFAESRKPFLPYLVFVGEYLRDFESFFALYAPGFKKILLRPADSPDEIDQRTSGDVEILGRISDEEYDQLLSKAIVFLRVTDGVAITTILECIARATPVLVNRHPGLEEYLGVDYPLFYDTLSQATAILGDIDRLAGASAYLASLGTRNKFSDEHFIGSFQNTAVYRSLPTSPSRRTIFPTFDLTIKICLHSRIGDLRELLERLSRQDYTGKFEVILWNNNELQASLVSEIALPYRERLNLKLIQSSENYYCITRLAAGSLMRGEALLVCDDDVLPEPGYVSKFVNGINRYGPDAIICARGHIFLPHQLNEEEPDRVWRLQENLLFFDEKEPDRRVHFFHADNCLIPREVVRDLAAHEMDKPEFILVDDYWMSFVIGHGLRKPVWKIQAGDVLSFTPSSDDPRVAMYHSPAVNEQRINFYIHHMREGWPSFVD